MLKKLFIMLALTVFTVPLAGAQDYDLELLVGPHLGYQEALDEESGDFDWGGFLRFKPFDWMGIEAAVDFAEDDFLDEDINVENMTLMGNVLFYPIPDVFYVSAGAGWVRSDLEFDDPVLEDDEQDEFAWNAGLGVEIPVMSWLSLTVDARYVFLDLDLDVDEVPAAEDIDSDFWMVRGGIALRFGGGDEF